MTNRNKKFAFDTMKLLIDFYPDARCELDANNPFQMLVAVALSAQCTDARVNMTTPPLFAKYPNAADLAKADIKDVENLIHSCGFYKNKAKNIVAAGIKVSNDFSRELPHDLNLLMTIPGVGRKTANVIMLEVFDDAQGIAVDTHVKRISKRIGFTNEDIPEKVEQDLLKLFPREFWKKINHVLIFHGRRTCSAKNPKCTECPIKDRCRYNQKTSSKN